MSDERAVEREKLRAAADMVIATGTNKDWYDTIDAGALAVARAWLKDDARIDRLEATAQAVLDHLTRVNEWIRDTGCIPNDAAGWHDDERRLREALAGEGGVT